MSNKTKQIFTIALVTTLILVTVFSFFTYKIWSQGKQLTEQIAILSENSAKEFSYSKLNRQVQETEGERDQLARAFFKEEKDSVVFLGEVESLARSLGLKLTTESLDKLVDVETKAEHVKMSFKYEGQRDVVVGFSRLMESTPYHSIVDKLSLKKLSDGNWQGNLTILITLESI